ncbi:hypothetical protein OG21DRAFT_1527960 [Imleria badia]|nr:hypothetical protein OG21DRAFT_1527960 [Imleria badia]
MLGGAIPYAWGTAIASEAAGADAGRKKTYRVGKLVGKTYKTHGINQSERNVHPRTRSTELARLPRLDGLRKQVARVTASAENPKSRAFLTGHVMAARQRTVMSSAQLIQSEQRRKYQERNNDKQVAPS